MRIEKVEEIAEMLKNNPDLAKAQVDKINHNLQGAVKASLSMIPPVDGNASPVVDVGWQKPTKYHSRRTLYDGIWYHSNKEAQYAMVDDLRVRVGELKFWLRQVPFILPGNPPIIYRLDFMEFYPDGKVEWIEVKGYRTKVGELKRRQCEALYHIKIIEV